MTEVMPTPMFAASISIQVALVIGGFAIALNRDVKPNAFPARLVAPTASLVLWALLGAVFLLMHWTPSRWFYGFVAMTLASAIVLIVRCVMSWRNPMPIENVS